MGELRLFGFRQLLFRNLFLRQELVEIVAFMLQGNFLVCPRLGRSKLRGDLRRPVGRSGSRQRRFLFSDLSRGKRRYIGGFFQWTSHLPFFFRNGLPEL